MPDMSKKTPLQVKDWRQMICKFRLLLREADAHMKHRARILIDCN